MGNNNMAIQINGKASIVHLCDDALLYHVGFYFLSARRCRR